MEWSTEPLQPPSITPISPPSDPAASVTQVAATAFAMLGYALSARALLLLSLIGAFVLGMLAIRAQTTMALAILAVYCAFTVLPVAYLELARARA